jgi:L-aspartate oxidase
MYRRKKMKYDVIIIGSGLAGLWTSLNLDKDLKVLILTKSKVWGCNSFYAQGGVTVARDKNDINSHIQDTLKAGAYHNNKKMVELLSNHSLEVIDDIESLGFRLDRDDNGNILFTKEGAHSFNRIVHAGGDATGRDIHKFIFQHDKNFFLDEMVVFDLLIEENRCYGVSVYQNGKKRNIYANSVVIASGGVGGLYKFDTNANTISGDLQGIAISKNITLSDMEMTQFHPTVYVKSKTAQKQLLSEALRGEGAKVVDKNRYRFLFEYDENGELASRDIVSRAIYDYRQKGNEVFLDFSDWSEKFFMDRFPTIYFKLKNLGYNLPNDLVPISPAFHYMMGGIDVDENSLVKGFENLFAVGEVANTQIHGANRLASNSLLECFVFGKICAKNINKNIQNIDKKFDINPEILSKKDDKLYKNKLRKIMWDKVGIIRTQKGLDEALEFVNETIEKVGLLTKYRFFTAREIILQAKKRKNSLGAHFIIN